MKFLDMSFLFSNRDFQKQFEIALAAEVLSLRDMVGPNRRVVFFLNVEDESTNEMVVNLLNTRAIGFELFKFSEKPCDWDAIVSGVNWCFWELNDPTEDAHWILTKVRNSPVDDILVFFWDGHELFHS